MQRRRAGRYQLEYIRLGKTYHSRNQPRFFRFLRVPVIDNLVAFKFGDCAGVFIVFYSAVYCQGDGKTRHFGGLSQSREDQSRNNGRKARIEKNLRRDPLPEQGYWRRLSVLSLLCSLFCAKRRRSRIFRSIWSLWCCSL